MDITIYTATGCTRCKIVKKFMDESNISYVEKDMKAEGKEDFQSFYKAHRSSVYRGPDGIEFPIITDNVEIRQGIGASIAYLHSGAKLDGFFSVGVLHQEWVDGIHVSLGDLKYMDDFIEVLRYIKSRNMKLQLDTNGKNSIVLQRVLDEKLADVVIMEVLGPRKFYSQILGEDVHLEDVEKSIAIMPQFSDYKFQTAIVPMKRENGETNYLTPEEIGETALFIKEATGNNKNKYFIKTSNPQNIIAGVQKPLDPLSSGQLFTYRTKARAHQVFTEIEK